MIRRIITLALCAAAFWAGMKFQALQLDGACVGAGGKVNAAGLCIGAAP